MIEIRTVIIIALLLVSFVGGYIFGSQTVENRYEVELESISELKIINENYQKELEINKRENEQLKAYNRELENKVYELNQLILTNEKEKKDPDSQLSLVKSIKHFRLFSPHIHDRLNVKDGFSFMGEIHESGIGHIQVELADKTGNILNKFTIDNNYFDDGVFNEWTFFTLRMNFRKVPKEEEGLFRIIDLQSNEKIEIKVYFEQ